MRATQPIDQATSMEARPGWTAPGATWDGQGTNFALHSLAATAVELCLFDNDDERRLVLAGDVGAIWHIYVADVGPGAQYAFRVHGPFEPERGLRFDPTRLLIDPYARAISRRCVVVDPAFDWGDDRPPATPWADTVIYELHVKGFTARHPDLPRAQRGTYAGLAHPATIEYLTALGISAVELLPVHHFAAEPAIVARGLTNYWGYCSIGYFAPHGPYSCAGDTGGQVTEFKSMVKALHAARLEVILDVVYNHTAEGGASGPTLSFRGIDNPDYYRLNPADRAEYTDYTGTGNTIDTRAPAALRLIMDSLRYWVTEMHVDGFRFDLASALARGDTSFDRHSGFLAAIGQDPVLSTVKLISEPWDAHGDGYQLGNFPPGWSEWNDRYRDSVRDFWRGHAPSLAEIGSRLAGSSDLFGEGRLGQNPLGRHRRSPQASVNFVTCHDGFTLRDLVSYDRKHNLANGEDGGDGTDNNRSWNCGSEGETADPAVLVIRRRQQRNLLATLFLSQGVPMLLAGDELNRTQRGNNNAYCHDSELSWIDWSPVTQAGPAPGVHSIGAHHGSALNAEAHRSETHLTDVHAGDVDGELRDFTRRLIALRGAHPQLRNRRFLVGENASDGSPVSPLHPLPDVLWFSPDAMPMSHQDWESRAPAGLGMLLPTPETHCDESSALLVFLNGGPVAICFVIPDGPWARAYEVELDTAGCLEGTRFEPGSTVRLKSRSLVVLTSVT